MKLFKIFFNPKIYYCYEKNVIYCNINWRANPEIEPIYTEIKGYEIIGLNINFLNPFGLIKGLDLSIKLDNITNTQYYNPYLILRPVLVIRFKIIIFKNSNPQG